MVEALMALRDLKLQELKENKASVILVVDEHGVYRTGLRELIETRVDQARVAEVPSIELIDASECFDLILIDAGCLTQQSLGVLKQVHEANPSTRFAVMSASNIRADVLNCLGAGFHGFICKLQSDNELVTAISDLLSGRIYVPRWLAEGDDSKSDVHHPGNGNGRMERLRLTPRQREILPLLAQGMSNKEIARHLHIAEGTTKIHTAALLRALGARNRTEAAFFAATLVVIICLLTGSVFHTIRHHVERTGWPGWPIVHSQSFR